MTSLHSEAAVQITRSIFKEIETAQTLAQADRRSIYTILSHFIHTKLEGITNRISECTVSNIMFLHYFQSND